MRYTNQIEYLIFLDDRFSFKFNLGVYFSITSIIFYFFLQVFLFIHHKKKRNQLIKKLTKIKKRAKSKIQPTLEEYNNEINQTNNFVTLSAELPNQNIEYSKMSKSPGKNAPSSQENFVLNPSKLQINTITNTEEEHEKILAKRQHTFCTKFWQLFWSGNPIGSIIYLESKFFPRHIRVTLIFFHIYFCFFVNSIFVIHNYNQHNFKETRGFIFSFLSLFFIGGFFSWITFIGTCFSIAARKSKFLLIKNEDEFYESLINFEREKLIKSIVLYFFIFISHLIFFTQFIGVFVVLKKKLLNFLLFSNLIVVLTHLIMIDVITYCFMSVIYQAGLNSQKFKEVYRFLNNLRIWVV